MATSGAVGRLAHPQQGIDELRPGIFGHAPHIFVHFADRFAQQPDIVAIGGEAGIGARQQRIQRTGLFAQYRAGLIQTAD